VLANVTLEFENKDLQFQKKDGVHKAVIHIYGRITTLSHRVRNRFEHTMEIMAADQMKPASLWQESIPLAPGTCRLNVVCKDVVAGTIQNYETTLTVPRFDDDKLASSSLILADGGTAGPRMNDTFTRDEELGIHVQLCNFGPDEKTHKADGVIEYAIGKVGSAEKVLEFSEAVAGPANQVTVEKLLPLSKFAPGQYELRMRVTDKNRDRTLEPRATFTVL